MLICALGVARDTLEMRLDLRVVVDLEVIGLIDVPVEAVVANLILAVVGDVPGLRLRRDRRHEDRQQAEDGQSQLA